MMKLSSVFITLLALGPVSSQRASFSTLRGNRQLQCARILERLDIVNAATDQTVGTLNDGETIFLNNFGMTKPQEFTVNAITCGTGIGSVTFELDGTYYKKIENKAAYFLCGNSGADANYCPEMTLGQHSLKVSVYSGSNAGGTLLDSKTVLFTVNQLNPAPVTAAPVPTPVTAAPVPAPVTAAPVPAPVTAAPVLAPVTAAPVPAPAPTATSPTSCTVPKVRLCDNFMCTCSFVTDHVGL
jgi:hypothetical protein